MTEKQTITVKFYGGGFVAFANDGTVLGRGATDEAARQQAERKLSKAPEQSEEGRGATDDEARQQAEAKMAREKETDIPK
jgi:hypothetical protein